MRMKTKSLSWKPKLHGKTYCSPACGAGCLKSAYDQAFADATATVKKMKTKGWQVHVWENRRWNWCLTNKLCGMSIHVTDDVRGRTFWCMMEGRDAKNATNGEFCWNVTENFKEPNKAVAAMVKYAMPIYKAWARGFENLKSIQPTTKGDE